MCTNRELHCVKFHKVYGATCALSMVKRTIIEVYLA